MTRPRQASCAASVFGARHMGAIGHCLNERGFKPGTKRWITVLQVGDDVGWQGRLGVRPPHGTPPAFLLNRGIARGRRWITLLLRRAYCPSPVSFC